MSGLQLILSILGFFVILVGPIGWCILGVGNSCYNLLGVLNFFTCGGCEIWNIVKLIMVIQNTLPDGNGVLLKPLNI